MKKMYWLLAAGLVTALVLFAVHTRRQYNRVEEDGGVRHYVDTNAPKTIQSQQICFFRCEFSTTDRMEGDTPIAGNVITLQAGPEDASYELQGRESENPQGSFQPDPEFFRELQKIVSQYDFAQYNGQHHKVSGLPPHIGMELEIGYDSGETILASDNQDCFLPLEAMEALVALFQQ